MYLDQQSLSWLQMIKTVLKQCTCSDKYWFESSYNKHCVRKAGDCCFTDGAKAAVDTIVDVVRSTSNDDEFPGLYLGALPESTFLGQLLSVLCHDVLSRAMP